MTTRPKIRIRLEESRDGEVIRAIEESSEQHSDDSLDGETTLGRLLYSVVRWYSTTGSGFHAVAELLKHMDSKPMKAIGEAVDRWGAAQNFDKCVTVAIDEERLTDE